MELNLWPGLLTLIYFCRLWRTGKRIYFCLLFKQRLSSLALCLLWNIMWYLTYSKWSIMNKLFEDYVGPKPGAQAWIGNIAPQCFRDSCLLQRHFKLKVSSVCKCCSWRRRLLVSLEVLILSGVWFIYNWCSNQCGIISMLIYCGGGRSRLYLFVYRKFWEVFFSHSFF